eukprot:6190429-Pleurochrysis_carterae.AAC.8
MRAPSCCVGTASPCMHALRLLLKPAPSPCSDPSLGLSRSRMSRQVPSEVSMRIATTESEIVPSRAELP